MIEFKLNTDVGTKVYEIEVNIRDDFSKHNSTDYHSNGIHIKEHEIAFQTDIKIALNDKYITCLDRQLIDREKERYYRYIEDISVSIVTKETYFPNGIFCKMYTLQNPKKQISKIKKEIINKINKEYGFLRFVNVESIIDEFKANLKY